MASKKRREFLLGSIATLVAPYLPLTSAMSQSSERPFFGLTESLPEEHDYLARIEGVLPPRLQGILYRNGPGIFERDGHRIRCLLDGDGMIQSFTFDGSGVRYRNAFVRTDKYRAESAAQKFLHQTWTTPRPGGWSSNVGIGSFPETAGVNAQVWNEELFALEDANAP